MKTCFRNVTKIKKNVYDTIISPIDYTGNLCRFIDVKYSIEMNKCVCDIVNWIYWPITKIIHSMPCNPP